MKVLVDMNLSPEWVAFLAAAGHEGIHWSSVGRPNEHDAVILRHAATTGHIMLTADLDFGELLAAGGTSGPSVVILRSSDTSPGGAGLAVLNVFRVHEEHLLAGALVSVDAARARIRLLPLRARE